MIQEKCMECGQLAVLSKHVRKHGLTTEQYYRKWLIKPGEGFCKVCGKPTVFAGMDAKCFHPYCSNKCHNNDPEYLAIRSENRKNKTLEEKAEIRAKQIAAWTQTMGDNYTQVMAHRGFETYKQKTGYNTPWENPEVKDKCKQAWNGENSPACLDSVKTKISESTKRYFNETESERKQNKLKRLQNYCENIIAVEDGRYTYKCPDCNSETQFGNKALRTAIKWNSFKHLCSKCSCMNGTSFKERAFISYIKSLSNFDVYENDRTLLNGKELDVYLPELKLAFEFDGKYWHADDRYFKGDDIMRQKLNEEPITAKMIWEYDLNKIKLCEEKGVLLVRVKEYDWDNDINIKHKISEVIKDAERKYTKC